jgi:hypothetical protein
LGRRWFALALLIVVTGVMLSLKPTYADGALTITPNPVGANQPITFSATVSDAHLKIYSGSVALVLSCTISL